jgi:hypothetical protein
MQAEGRVENAGLPRERRAELLEKIANAWAPLGRDGLVELLRGCGHRFLDSRLRKGRAAGE